MTDAELISAAQAVQGRFPLARDQAAGSVGAALVTRSGRVFTGICLDLDCGLGTCAEHGAIAEMLKARETDIATIVAVSSNGVVAPCGRCRELMLQVSDANLDARVLLPSGTTTTLRELLPHRWR